MKTKLPLIEAVLIITGVFGVAIACKEIHSEYLDYVAESECVAKHISQGIERRDIETNSGNCWVNAGD